MERAKARDNYAIQARHVRTNKEREQMLQASM
jgi:hypothetical protein